MKKVIVFIAGMVVMGVVVVMVMPKMMIVTHESKFDFDTTVTMIEENISASPGWIHKKTNMMHQEIYNETGGKELGVRVAGIKLCKGEYAYTILKDEQARYMSALMPCSISVWENEKGSVFISEMNIPLMGKLFGGIISEVMAGKVGPEEKVMLEGIIRD